MDAHVTIVRSLQRVSFLALLAGSACVHPTQALATVYFALDAPLCSSVIPVELSIDGAIVASDTFRVNLSVPHTTSRGFTTWAGRHVIGARTTFGYVWADTTVTLLTGQSLTRSLPFYCS